MALIKRLLVGRPIPTTEQEHQRIPKTIALAVFSSDAISSTAYATEEILFAIVAGGASLALGLDTLIPIAIAVIALLVIVAFSYRQTIFAYPSGGGSYVVSRENLGENPSLIAGASLLVDYILTVAVSISAGVAAIISIPEFSDLADSRVELGIALIIFITLMNLRGLKESGRIFAAPTYLYIVALSGLILYGLYRIFIADDIGLVPFDRHAFEGTAVNGGSLGLFLILKGFSSGAVALTGVEAISNGVPAFRRPESKNAATTLVWMGVVLGSLFLGVSVLASHLEPYPSHDRTVIAQMGIQVFGNGAVFFVLQIATAMILTLAANTAYADFPRLSSIIARDGYLPRQLANRGDRLVFSNGVIVLAGSAAVLLVAFGGKTNALIPLYAVGVFTSFTLSQSGMVRHHLKEREENWRRHIAINATGAVATGIVTLIIGVSKFTSGAWVSIVVISLIILLFKGIRSHYKRVGKALRVEPGYRARPLNNTVVVLVGRVHKGVLNALAYAKSLNPSHLIAVSVVSDEEEDEAIREQWAEYGIEIPLETVYNPYREMSRPVLRFIDELDKQWENDVITVVIPEFVVKRWWEHLLHNQSALFLKGRLLFRKGTVVTSVPYHVE
ncbi:MAG: APC family permease [Acidimicrobiia bacterium]|nr:APC family permease [Acidimicrobiia bacterium]